MRVAEWKMADGKTIAIKDMDDKHLVNSIRMLERNAPVVKNRYINEGYKVLSFVQGEQATWDIEHDIDRLEEMSDDEFLKEAHPVYSKMLWHAKRRGIKL